MKDLTVNNISDQTLFSEFFAVKDYEKTFKVDIHETGNEYVIEAEMPGIKKEEIDLTLSMHHLIISIHHEEHVKDTTKNFILRERRQYATRRTIYLGDAISHWGDRIKAKLNDGLLVIHIPKISHDRTHKKIEIEVLEDGKGKK